MDHLIDARWLPPPEPMERVLDRLETLPPGDRIRLLIHREPYLLLSALREWGYDYQMTSCGDGCYEVNIWQVAATLRKQSPAA